MTFISPLSRPSPGKSRGRLASWAVEQAVRHFLQANPEATIKEVLSDAEETLAMVGLDMTEYNRGEALDWARLVGPQCDCPGPSR